MTVEKHPVSSDFDSLVVCSLIYLLRNDLYTALSQMPRGAATRKLNDLIKRARLARARSLGPQLCDRRSTTRRHRKHDATRGLGLLVESLEERCLLARAIEACSASFPRNKMPSFMGKTKDRARLAVLTTPVPVPAIRCSASTSRARKLPTSRCVWVVQASWR